MTRHRHHAHTHGHGHSHEHFHVDPSLIATTEGIRALKISLAILLGTAVVQAGIVWLTGSVSLLADTIHNFGDALTSVPLWIAFRLSQRRPTKRYSHGYHRTEDLAGLVIVGLIGFSAVVAGYQAIQRLIQGGSPTHLGVLALAAVLGFLGNEAVAQYRIGVGRRIGSAALVADGQHARIDGLTSLVVLVGAAGAWIGLPILDPIAGLVITVMILFIVRDAARAVLRRLLDGIEPEVIDQIQKVAGRAPGVQAVRDVRARWFGHEIRAELSIAVDGDLTVAAGHAIAKEVQHALIHGVAYLTLVKIHVDPLEEAGDHHHPHAHQSPVAV